MLPKTASHSSWEVGGGQENRIGRLGWSAKPRFDSVVGRKNIISEQKTWISSKNWPARAQSDVVIDQEPTEIIRL